MATPRDLVRFVPGERVDLPDHVAAQDGARSETRSAFRAFLFGGDTTRVVAPFMVAATATPSEVEVTVGVAAGCAVPTSGVAEYGTVFGLEGDPSQILDMTGRPDGTYGIYVRMSFDAGDSASRVLWSDTAGAEVAAVVDTRRVAGWDVCAELASPGADWVYVGSVVSTAGVASAHTTEGELFFEGDAGNLYLNEWGLGPNDRDADRVLYGVHDLHMWVQAIRSQLCSIIHGNCLATEWYADPPFSLYDANQHAIAVTDPHGAQPEFTGGCILGDVPEFSAPMTAYRSYAFSALRWDVMASGGNNVRFGPNADGTAAVYVSYEDSNAAGPDLILDLNAGVGQIGWDDSNVEIVQFRVAWNQQTAAAEVNALNRIVWTYQFRTVVLNPGAAWTTHSTGIVNGGHQMGPAVDPDIATIVVNHATPDASYQYRLLLNLQGTADGNSPVVYGVNVEFTTEELGP